LVKILDEIQTLNKNALSIPSMTKIIDLID